MKYIIIYKKHHYIEMPVHKEQKYHGVCIVDDGDGVYVGKQKITPFTFFNTTLGRVLVINDEKQCYRKEPTVFIGPKKADVELRGSKQKIVIKDKKMICKYPQDIYINGRKCFDNEALIEYGDIIQVRNVRFILRNKYMEIIGDKKDYLTKVEEYKPKDTYFDGFPYYSRSPRIIKKIDDATVEIVNPPYEQSMHAKGVLATFVPTLISIVISIATGVLMGRGTMLIIMVFSSGVAFITNVIKYSSEKKEIKIKNQKRKEIYQQYVVSLRKKLHAKFQHNRDVLAYNYLDLTTISKRLQKYDSRMYERTYQDEDFLEVLIGHYQGESPFAVVNKQEVIELDKDPLKEEAKQLCQQFSTMTSIPLCVDLKQAHIGLVGEKYRIHQQLKGYLMELTFFHSYHDIEIVCIYHERDKQEFDYIKWYPHVRLKAINVASNIHNERMRDQIMGSVYQILKERKNKADNKQKEMRFLPHLVFIIDEPSLVLNHSVMEFLQLHSNKLGYSIIYTTDKQSKLPENIKSVIAYEDATQGRLIINNGDYVNKTFTLLDTNTILFEENARILSSFIHEEKKSSQIPENIDFLGLYGVETVEEIDILQKWKENKIYKTMAVPLGLRSIDDVVYLDLHEKAHGPHGLVAGTTGSGKSEIVQSYIVSLAIHFHPHDVGFLLIDYKGGGMANLFKNLPHVLGTITNLDGSESLRALVSIKSELKRRQRVFEQALVNNINDYTKSFKSGEAKEPLPHVLIICDEFAELKKEQPEFMKELVSTARVGRSLGVHLILATQKPSGVVDDQIWSNAKFKLCLKVQNEADSKEILKTPDAATITLPGRCYLQVGNNEIYELFQSAYSGGAYIVGKNKEEIVDPRVYLLNDLGQGQVINEDLSASQYEENVKLTQLDRVVDYIQEVYSQQKVVEVKRPWLPALSTHLVLDYQDSVGKNNKLDLTCEIGQVDIPEEQKQKPYTINLQTEGNIAYFASSGYGKSMFLSTIITSLVSKNTVDNVYFYLLDFGNSALIPFNQLAHTAAYITLDDDERFSKFIKLMQEEMRSRKQIIATNQTQNFSVHNRTSSKKLKAMVIICDQFDVVKEKGVDAETFFSKLARDGVGLGIYLIISATRTADVRYATMNQIKTKIVGYLFDDGEAMQIIGRSEWKVPDSKGRILVKTDTVHLAQMNLPVEFSDEVEYLDAIKTQIQKVNRSNQGNIAKRIAVLPEQLSYLDLNTYEKEQEYTFILGLDQESVKVRGFNPTNHPFLIIGPQRCGKTNALQLLYSQTKGHKYVFDTSKMNFSFSKQEVHTHYAYDNKGYQELLGMLKEQVTKRLELFHQAYRNDDTIIPQQFYQTLDTIHCFIDDVDYFHEMAKAVAKLEVTLTKAMESGICFMVCGDSTKMSPMNTSASIFKRTDEGLVLGSCMMVNPFTIKMNEAPDFGNGLLFTIYGNDKIKVAKFNSTN